MKKGFNQIQTQLFLVYSNQLIVGFISKQIEELNGLEDVKCYNNYCTVRFKIPNQGKTYSFMSDTHFLDFIFVFGKGYPQASPRVFCKSNLLKPSINDCRDLYPLIMGIDEWDYRITLRHIQQRIPKFLSNLQKNRDIYYNARVGNFHLNSIYPIQLIKQLRGDNLFFAFEILEEGDFRMVILDVSPTHLAIFSTKQQPFFQKQSIKIPTEKDISVCMMIFYAELGSLSQIMIDRSNFSDLVLTFVSQKPHNLTLQSCTKIIKLKVKKGVNFILQVLRNRKYYDIAQIKLSLSPSKVTLEQQELLKQIQRAEQAIEYYLNMHTVKDLIDSYQAAIQYYSSQSIPYYEVYLQFITKLYQRKAVRKILGTDISIQEK